MFNSKIQFGSGKKASFVSFTSWQGRPMHQQQQVDYTTRLGGHKLVVSNVKKESPMTQVTATIAAKETTVKAAIQTLEASIAILQQNVGVRFTFTDDLGITIDRCYIVGQINYTIKAVGGAADALATITFNVMTDIDKE